MGRIAQLSSFSLNERKLDQSSPRGILIITSLIWPARFEKLRERRHFLPFTFRAVINHFEGADCAFG